jgi:hypothetical protein
LFRVFVMPGTFGRGTDSARRGRRCGRELSTAG